MQLIIFDLGTREYLGVICIDVSRGQRLSYHIRHYRLVYIDKQASVVRLEVERVGYVNKRVMVQYSTRDLNMPGIQIIAGVRVFQALGGADYFINTGQLIFEPGEVSIQ